MSVAFALVLFVSTRSHNRHATSLILVRRAFRIDQYPSSLKICLTTNTIPAKSTLYEGEFLPEDAQEARPPLPSGAPKGKAVCHQQAQSTLQSPTRLNWGQTENQPTKNQPRREPPTRLNGVARTPIHPLPYSHRVAAPPSPLPLPSANLEAFRQDRRRYLGVARRCHAGRHRRHDDCQRPRTRSLRSTPAWRF